MTDRSTFDAFEQRIAAELDRYVEPAVDPKPATEIAEAAMQPRGLTGRARKRLARRRLCSAWPRRSWSRRPTSARWPSGRDA